MNAGLSIGRIGASALMALQSVNTRRPSGVPSGKPFTSALIALLAIAIRVLSNTRSCIDPEASRISSACRSGPAPASATTVSQPPAALIKVTSARPTLPDRSATSTVSRFSPSGSGCDGEMRRWRRGCGARTREKSRVLMQPRHRRHPRPHVYAISIDGAFAIPPGVGGRS
jgi:hypothetical protein